MQVLKVDVPVWGSNPSLLREMFWVLSFLLLVGHHVGSGVYGEIVSQSLLPTSVWLSSHLPSNLAISQPAFSFEEEIFPHVEL